MQELAKQASFAGVQFIDIPAEDLAEVALKHQIDAVPTVVFFKAGSAVDRIDGVDIASLTAKCRKLAGVSGDAGDSLDDRLKALINRSNVMIFMKGDRNVPRCGFSKQLIAIINETGLVQRAII